MVGAASSCNSQGRLTPSVCVCACRSELFEWVRPKAGATAFIRFTGPLTSEELGAALTAAGIGIKPAYAPPIRTVATLHACLHVQPCASASLDIESECEEWRVSHVNPWTCYGFLCM